MGSSPAKDMKTGSYEHSFESPAKQKLNKGGEGQDQDKIFNDKGEHIGDYVNDKPVMKLKELVQKKPKYIEAEIPPGFKRPVVKKETPVKPTDEDMKKYSDLEKYDDDRPVSSNKQKQQSSGKDKVSEQQTSELGKKVKPLLKKGYLPTKKANISPAKQLDPKVEKALKAFDRPTPAVTPKKLSDAQVKAIRKAIKEKIKDPKTIKKLKNALKKGYTPTSPAKQAKTKGLGPRTAFGGVKNPELTKTKKPFSTKVMKDGPKKQVTGVKNPGNWQPHPDTFKKRK